MIVFGFYRERIRTVAFNLVAQRADHLRMTGIAAFANIDIASGKLEGRIEAHVRRIFDRLMDCE